MFTFIFKEVIENGRFSSIGVANNDEFEEVVIVFAVHRKIRRDGVKVEKEI